MNQFNIIKWKLLQSCLTLCDPVVCSLPSPSVHGIAESDMTERLNWTELMQWVGSGITVPWLASEVQSTVSTFLFLLFLLFSCPVVSDSLQPHGLQHTRPPCPSPTPRVYSNSCPLSRWCHPTISSSVVPFSSCLQSFPASGSFPVSQFFTSSGQRTGVSASASVLPVNIHDWFPLRWTGWISLQSKGLSRVFSKTTVQKHQFFSTQLSL